MTDLWTRIPPQHPLLLNYAQGQKFGIAVAADELFYRTDTPLENVLEASVACKRFSRLTPAQFDDHLDQLFQHGAGESRQIAQDIDQEIDLTALSEELPDNADLLSDENDAPVIRLINAVLHEAVREGASDVHIETFEKSLVVRFRIDGVLKPVLQPAKKLAPLLISRIKVMARLDIAEKRLPQDGRISLRLGRKNIDVRVSTLPSQYGERAVLRLLDKNSLRLTLENMGLSAVDSLRLKV